MKVDSSSSSFDTYIDRIIFVLTVRVKGMGDI